MHRRTFSIGLGAAAILASRTAPAQQDSRPLTIVVPYPPGGISDIVARLLAKSMAVTLNRSVLVENRPGGSTLIGTRLVQRAAPDGNTLLLHAHSFMMNPGTLQGADYDPINDFEAVAKLTTSPYLMMVNKDVPARTPQEFIAWAKTQPQGVLWGSAGSGGSIQVMLRAFERNIGAKTTLVPYKGNADIITALIGGQIHLTTTPPSAVFDSAAQAGHIRYIAITTGNPSPFYPDLPTLRSVVPTMPADQQWLALFAPRATPRPALEQLSGAVAKALDDPSVKEVLTKNKFQVDYLDHADFGAFVRKSRADWEALIAASGIKFD